MTGAASQLRRVVGHEQAVIAGEDRTIIALECGHRQDRASLNATDIPKHVLCFACGDKVLERPVLACDKEA